MINSNVKSLYFRWILTSRVPDVNLLGLTELNVGGPEGFEPISLPMDLIGINGITSEGFGSELFDV